MKTKILLARNLAQKVFSPVISLAPENIIKTVPKHGIKALNPGNADSLIKICDKKISVTPSDDIKFFALKEKSLCFTKASRQPIPNSQNLEGKE